MNIKYVGAMLDYSGYGEAARHDVLALLDAGVNITAEIPKYTLELTDFGSAGERCLECENKSLEYKIKILHVTPNVYPSFFEQGKYHIGRVIWETDKLPDDFARNAQLCDEIWTASEFNKKAIEKAGVCKPIYVIPEAIENNESYLSSKPYLVPNQRDFKFYSMFEWTERKNPNALLEAYWREFENESGVSLTIKTYVDNFRPEKMLEITENIKRLKYKLGLKRYAPIYLFTNLMDRHQIYRFHRTFDCFVSAHRGEGWGIPQMEAMLMERPIITTACGGINEYINKDIAYPISYKLVQLRGNTRNQHWYTEDQNWAEIDLDDLRKAMRDVFNNQEKSRLMGKQARQFVLDNFQTSVVGKSMVQRLSDIHHKI